ncbi:hypothetical protein LX36DRAFT_747953 [Colletotrichum falcatum]|nr:hypothetical protein LX36DRAFT_747953 [Colletotrichum falcatum]
MHLSSLYVILGFALTISAQPPKAGSVHNNGERERCGVVAFQPDGKIWMVESKSEGWILPKGGYDVNEDSSWEDCVVREAAEEAGAVIDRDSITRLHVDEGTLYWFKAKVLSHGPRKDRTLATRKQPITVTAAEAMELLKTGSQKKKRGMQRALHAAI